MKAIIIGASSDIGSALSSRWTSKGWSVSGTFRTYSNKDGVQDVHCDLNDIISIQRACGTLSREKWDVLVLCPGDQKPVGPFLSYNFMEWERSIHINFTRQIAMVHKLLPSRNIDSKNRPLVLFFAGGGTNSAPVNYSAYTVSKIALIKMCELLDSEIPDTRFTTIGPGWVKTKIHQATLDAGSKAGDNWEKTGQMMSGDECTPMDTVLDCIDWVVQSPQAIVGGRNFSVVHDKWGEEELELKLVMDENMYKLRRSGNDERF